MIDDLRCANLPPLQTIIENTPGCSFSCVCDEKLTLLHISEDFLAVLGYTRDDLRGGFLPLIFPPCQEQFLLDNAQQVLPGTVQESELCLCCKDGNTIWRLVRCRHVLQTDASDILCCTVEDLFAGCTLHPYVADVPEQLVLKHGDGLIIDWDIRQNTLHFPDNWADSFGYQPTVKTVNPSVCFSHVHEADREKLYALSRQLRSGMRYVETELRLLRYGSPNTYVWCKLLATSQCDAAGMPIHGICVVSDIHEEKQQLQALLDTVCRDGLTHLLNKAETQKRITASLESNPVKCSALLVIDVDNFKQINDAYSHLAGDSILTELAATLVRQFRAQDIVGRIGGDEFMIFMHDIPDGVLATAKAEQLLTSLQKLLTETIGSASLSCSIGIALAPQHGTTFRELYHAADLALYMAKRNGKNRYELFNHDEALRDSAAQVGVRLPFPMDSLPSAFDKKFLPDYIYQLLQYFPDTQTAVNTLLAIMGLQVNVSHAYVFKSEADGQHFYSPFEWCNVGVAPQMPQYQDLTYDDLGFTTEVFREDGIFFCHDIQSLQDPLRSLLSSQGVQSILLCFLADENGNFAGGVGFSDCKRLRLWTQVQIDALRFLAKIIGFFLFDQRPLLPAQVV